MFTIRGTMHTNGLKHSIKSDRGKRKMFLFYHFNRFCPRDFDDGFKKSLRYFDTKEIGSFLPDGYSDCATEHFAEKGAVCSQEGGVCYFELLPLKASFVSLNMFWQGTGREAHARHFNLKGP